MLENQTRSALRRGETVFGVLSTVSEPSIPELVGLLGFDFFMLDAEHGPIGPAQAANLVRACEVVGITPLARVASQDPKMVLQYLDAGVMGIMMPGVEDVGSVQGLVAAVKYPPLGRRGLGLDRAAQFGLGQFSQPEYVTFANEQTLVLPQFEEAALLDRLAEIASVEGVDGVVIGPRDLALNMGFADGPHHSEVQRVIDRAIQVIRDTGAAAGITAETSNAAREQMQRGANLILTSLTSLIRESAVTLLSVRRPRK